MSENFKKTTERPDRVLGDEWADWEGDGGGTIKEGKWLFLGFSLAVFLIIDVALGLLYYFILPRLSMIARWLPYVVFFLFLAWGVITLAFWIQLAFTAVQEKNHFFFKKQIYFIFDLIFGRVFKLARFLKISRDRVGQSFVKVSNAVVRAVDRDSKGNKVLILLPRCLTKEAIQQVYALKEKYPVEIFTVSGGELARKKVKEINPTAIIGVACERDLVSGIRDVSHKISVIGVPNERPNGPCKDTIIDIEEITKAVEFYLR